MTEVIIIDEGLRLTNNRTGDEDRIELLKGGERARFGVCNIMGVTQGQAGKIEHLLDLGDIPLVQSDRGGQNLTYHGPGQIILYTLIPLKNFGLSVRDLVRLLENR